MLCFFFFLNPKQILDCEVVQIKPDNQKEGTVGLQLVPPLPPQHQYLQILFECIAELILFDAFSSCGIKGAVSIPESRLARMPKPLRGHFFNANITPKKVLMEFKVSPDAVLPVGTQLHAAHFVPGQYLDLTGKSF